MVLASLIPTYDAAGDVLNLLAINSDQVRDVSITWNIIATYTHEGELAEVTLLNAKADSHKILMQALERIGQAGIAIADSALVITAAVMLRDFEAMPDLAQIPEACRADAGYLVEYCAHRLLTIPAAEPVLTAIESYRPAPPPIQFDDELAEIWGATASLAQRPSQPDLALVRGKAFIDRLQQELHAVTPGADQVAQLPARTILSFEDLDEARAMDALRTAEIGLRQVLAGKVLSEEALTKMLEDDDSPLPVDKMSKLPQSPLAAEEQQCLIGIGRIGDLDAQANALRVQLGTLIARAQQDDMFDAALVEYVYALQHAGQEPLARLVSALSAGRMWSTELSNRMRAESGAPELSWAEKEYIWACQRMWDIAHGIAPTTALLRLFDTPEHARLSLQAIAAIVATLAFIALMLLLPNAKGPV